MLNVANYFWNSVTAHGSGESTYYLWMYREEGKSGDAPRIEDIGHGGYDPQAYAFADKIDGSDRFEDPEKQRRKSIRWLSLSDWDRRVFTNAGWQLTNEVKLKKALSYAEFL